MGPGQEWLRVPSFVALCYTEVHLEMTQEVMTGNVAKAASLGMNEIYL